MDQFIAQIMYFAGNYAPEGWLLCDGSVYRITQYQALFALIGNRYGGSYPNTFAVPDLRGRVGIGTGQGPNLPSYQNGDSGGESSVTLQVQNLPMHNHSASFTGNGTMNVSGTPGSTQNPGPGFIPTAINTTKIDATQGSSQNLNIFGPPGGNISLPAINLSGLTASIQMSGNGQAHDNMVPYLPMTACIAYSGNWPPQP